MAGDPQRPFPREIGALFQETYIQVTR
jgi:hypothetical protein